MKKTITRTFRKKNMARNTTKRLKNKRRNTTKRWKNKRRNTKKHLKNKRRNTKKHTRSRRGRGIFPYNAFGTKNEDICTKLTLNNKCDESLKDSADLAHQRGEKTSDECGMFAQYTGNVKNDIENLKFYRCKNAGSGKCSIEGAGRFGYLKGKELCPDEKRNNLITRLEKNIENEQKTRKIKTVTKPKSTESYLTEEQQRILDADNSSIPIPSQPYQHQEGKSGEVWFNH